jgi:hypothetical protein
MMEMCATRCNRTCRRLLSQLIFPLDYRSVKHVVPDCAWPRVAGKQVDSQSWDAALNVVLKSLVEIAVANKLNKISDDPLLAEAVRQCDELQASKYLRVVRTNCDLAKKYAISRRTVTNWRKEGCPFEDGQWQVLDWMFLRPYLPRRAKEKFSCQFQRRFRSACGHLRATFVLLGEPIPDHLREF